MFDKSVPMWAQGQLTVTKVVVDMSPPLGGRVEVRVHVPHTHGEPYDVMTFEVPYGLDGPAIEPSDYVGLPLPVDLTEARDWFRYLRPVPVEGFVMGETLMECLRRVEWATGSVDNYWETSCADPR